MPYNSALNVKGPMPPSQRDLYKKEAIAAGKLSALLVRKKGANIANHRRIESNKVKAGCLYIQPRKIFLEGFD